MWWLKRHVCPHDSNALSIAAVRQISLAYHVFGIISPFESSCLPEHPLCKVCSGCVCQVAFGDRVLHIMAWGLILNADSLDRRPCGKPRQSSLQLGEQRKIGWDDAACSTLLLCRVLS